MTKRTRSQAVVHNKAPLLSRLAGLGKNNMTRPSPTYNLDILLAHLVILCIVILNSPRTRSGDSQGRRCLDVK